MKKIEELGISPTPWDCDIQEGDTVCDSIGYNVCCVDGDSKSQVRANARLIAAAPKMYEALRKLIDACGEVGYKDGGTAACYESEHHLYDALHDAKAALAEAAGESEVKNG